MDDLVNDDARDLAAAIAGDELAFARLYDRHGPVVLSLCRQHTVEDAEDATQETFIRAFRKLHRVEDVRKLRPFLYGIAKHVCSERRRARKRRMNHEQESAMQTARQAASEQRGKGSAAESAERQEQLARLDKALQQLDDRERLAIHLYYLEADPTQAAADALGLSRSGYYKLLDRARRSLTGLMGEVKTT